jgi:hypothetical protein
MRHTSYTPLIIVVLALVGPIGCWNETEMIDRAVWSDDDTGQAYVRLLFEEGPKVNPLSMTHPRRNFRHQLFIQNVDGSERQAVTNVQEFQTGANFYYMRQAGYLIIDVFEAEDEIRYDLVRLPAGDATTIATHSASGRACESFEVIPSYRGQIIAIVERTADSDADRRCPTGEVIVTFIDAASLSDIAKYRWQVTDMVQTGWTDADELIVSAPDDGVWLVTPDTGPTPADPATCVYPRTTSGSMSADGVVIGGGLSPTDPITVFPPFPDGDPFDCR